MLCFNLLWYLPNMGMLYWYMGRFITVIYSYFIIGIKFLFVGWHLTRRMKSYYKKVTLHSSAGVSQSQTKTHDLNFIKQQNGAAYSNMCPWLHVYLCVNCNVCAFTLFIFLPNIKTQKWLTEIWHLNSAHRIQYTRLSLVTYDIHVRPKQIALTPSPSLQI